MNSLLIDTLTFLIVIVVIALVEPSRWVLGCLAAAMVVNIWLHCRGYETRQNEKALEKFQKRQDRG